MRKNNQEIEKKEEVIRDENRGKIIRIIGRDRKQQGRNRTLQQSEARLKKNDTEKEKKQRY